MSNLLSGQSSLGYTGTNAPNPPNLYSVKRNPTPQDWQNFSIGDIWINYLTSVPFILVSLVGNVATWVTMSSATAVESITGNSGGPVPALNNNLNIVGDGVTITVSGNPGTNTLTISEIGGQSIQTITGDNGQTASGANVNLLARFAGSTVVFAGNNASQMGFTITDLNSNIIMGSGAGNNTLTGTNNVTLGLATGASFTTGGYNSLFGSAAGDAITSGNYNICFGSTAGSGITIASSNTIVGTAAATTLVTGNSNTIVGALAGGAYTGNESSNILIKNNGVVGESNTIRIGTPGIGAGQQSSCYVAGITGVPVAGAAVIVSTAGQLGVTVSSKRFKESIKSMGDYSSPIMKLRPVTFEYKNSPGSIQRGLIAEEAALMMPDLVMNDEEGTPITVRYHELPVLLLNELQKLSAEHKKLQNRLEALEAQAKI